MNESSDEDSIIACRASRLDRQTTQAVLDNRHPLQLSKQQLELAKQMFEMLLVDCSVHDQVRILWWIK